MPFNDYQLSSPPPGKVLAEVGPFRNVNRVSAIVAGDGQPIRANVGTAGITQGGPNTMFKLEAKIIG